MIKNLLWAAMHHGVGRGAVFVFFLALPSLMTIEEVGHFTFWYTVLLVLCQPPLDFSLTMVVVKYTARGELEKVRQALAAAVGLLPVLLIGLGLMSMILPVPHRLIGILLLSLGLSLPLNLVFGYFRGLEQMQVEGVVGSLHKIFGLALLFALFRMGFKGSLLPALALVGMGISGWLLLLGLWSGRIRGMLSALRQAATSSSAPLALWREGLALGAVGLVGILYLRIDVVMLGTMVGPAEVGSYFTASKIVEVAFIVPHILMLVFFPRLVRSTDLRPAVKRMALLLGGLSVVALMAVLALGRWAVPLLYDSSALRISALVMALAPVVLPVYLGHLFTQALVVLDLQRRYLLLASGGLLVNLALNAILIPHYQGFGAAAATVFTELMITLAAGLSVARERSTRRANGPGPAARQD